MAVLQAVADDPSMIAFLSDWVEAITLPLVPTALAAVAGWKAGHTPRPAGRPGTPRGRTSRPTSGSV
jgi:hypothetical protein